MCRRPFGKKLDGLNFFNMTPQQYTESSAHLPPFLRDFHDQKDLFKTIWGRMDLSNFPEVIRELGWMNFHMVIIDIFLWWMAKRGYTLQRSRAKVEFLGLQEDIEEYEKQLNEEFWKYFNSSKQ